MRKIFFVLYSILLILLFLVLFFRPINSINDDLGRHILLGNIITSGWSVPKINLLSYTAQSFPFINTSWFSEVLFAMAVKMSGFDGLLLGSVVVVALSLFLQVRFIILRFSKWAVLSASFLFLITLGFRTDLRPEIFSMLFISISITILYSYREKATNWIFALILIELLWVNMHIYFIAGPLLIGLFILERVLQKKLDFNLLKLFLVFIGVFLITFINPNGVKGAFYPLVVFQNYGFPVIENQSVVTLFTLYNTQSVLLPILLIVLSAILQALVRKSMRYIDLFLLIVFGFLSLLHFRNILLFIFIMFIPTTRNLDIFLKTLSHKTKKLPKNVFYIFYPLSVIMLLAIILKSIYVDSLGFGVIDHGKKSVDFLTTHDIEGRIFNDFNIGGYLSSRIYPRLVYVDNRPEAYPASFFRNEYLPVFSGIRPFSIIDKKYLFDVIILSHWDGSSSENKLFKEVLTDPQFALVYMDSYAFVMVRKTNDHKDIIDKFGKQVRVSQEKNNIQELIRYYAFYKKSEWGDDAENLLSNLKEKDPKLCTLYDYPLIYRNLDKEDQKCK